MNKAMISIKTQPTESGYQQEKVNINADDLFQQKHSIRSKLRRQLRAMNPSLRHEEDCAIQKIVLDSPWFKSSTSLCAYISCASLFEVDTSQIISEVLSSYADSRSLGKKLLVLGTVDTKSGSVYSSKSNVLYSRRSNLSHCLGRRSRGRGMTMLIPIHVLKLALPAILCALKFATTATTSATTPGTNYVTSA
ncbi:hypothetical protein EJ110_NYTH18574 [Nymphaea thermarum]|nr:hypothetical protein EJ110_NYTH18574 [Nymphaea thermarum]